MSKPVYVGELKIGQYVIIDGEPCRIVDFEKSKPGKHGSAKARITAISVFTGQKKTLLSPVDGRTEVPMIDKRTAQGPDVTRLPRCNRNNRRTLDSRCHREPGTASLPGQLPS